MNCSHQGDGWCLDCVGKLVAERDELKKKVEAANTYPKIHTSHEWCGGLFNQCIRCAAWCGREASYFPCDQSRLAGKTEPCCECGEDYPRSDLIAGHIFCAACRPKESK
jgi:hypothetical protein